MLTEVKAPGRPSAMLRLMVRLFLLLFAALPAFAADFPQAKGWFTEMERAGEL